MMQKKKIGNVPLYYPDGAETSEAALEEEDRQLLEIVQTCKEQEYHDEITSRKNWTIMYQLAESRANIIEWLELPPQAKVLELGAGCGTITSALLKKGAAVTCLEEKYVYCSINAQRHREAKEQSLTIYAASLEQCEAELDSDYDVVTAIGLPLTEGRAKQLLRRIYAHLKPQGMLILTIKNKFGLKYWAGNKEPYTHRYFAGLENDGIRLYSPGRMRRLLTETGFGCQQTYYPYPDERFALNIYSDRYLPKKGDMNYNIANYEDDRILLFDEQKVFDSIIEEGQLPFFANACLFLAEKGQAQKEQKDIYIRYAADRSRAFAVCTQMTDRYVQKRALYTEGAAHIAHMKEACEQLGRQYAAIPKMQFNRCESGTDADGNVYAQFERLDAQALSEQVEQAVLADDMQDVFQILQKLIQIIRNGGNHVPFEMTDGFRNVFGTLSDADALQQTVCSSISDIDLILPNILVDKDGVWHVIDYEWTFFFPVPQNFIIYRTLFFLNHENPQKEELSMHRLLAAADIPQEEAVVYAQMEPAFQQYVTGECVPYREMVNLLERRFFNMVQLKEDYDRLAAQNELLKGKGIWKAARKIKKKLTGN